MTSPTFTIKNPERNGCSERISVAVYQTAQSLQPTEMAAANPFVHAALIAYENARMDGLCHDGAWECALTAVRVCHSETGLDFAQLLLELTELIQKRRE